MICAASGSLAGKRPEDTAYHLEAGQIQDHCFVVRGAVEPVDGAEQVVAALLVHYAWVAPQRLQPVARERELASLHAPEHGPHNVSQSHSLPLMYGDQKLSIFPEYLGG